MNFWTTTWGHFQDFMKPRSMRLEQRAAEAKKEYRKRERFPAVPVSRGFRNRANKKQLVQHRRN